MWQRTESPLLVQLNDTSFHSPGVNLLLLCCFCCLCNLPSLGDISAYLSPSLSPTGNLHFHCISFWISGTYVHIPQEKMVLVISLIVCLLFAGFFLNNKKVLELKFLPNFIPTWLNSRHPEISSAANEEMSVLKYYTGYIVGYSSQNICVCFNMLGQRGGLVLAQQMTLPSGLLKIHTHIRQQ